MGISIWQLVIVLAIVLLLFGTKRLKNLGSDLGSAIKGFKSSVDDGKNEAQRTAENDRLEADSQVIDGEVTKEEENKA